MKLVKYAVVALCSTLSLWVAGPAVGQTAQQRWQADLDRRTQACAHLEGFEDSPPAQASRPLELEALGISIEIPENYRAMARSAHSADIFAPESYIAVQCGIESQVPTSIDEFSVTFYIGESTSKEMLFRESLGDRRSGVTRLLGTSTVDGREAFVYIREGLHKDLIVRVNYTDRDESLLISTTIYDNELPMKETFERVLSSLRFL